MEEYNLLGQLINEFELKEGKIQKIIRKEYIYDGILIFEGEYKDGEKYKGKEYNYYGKLIFEGEYKDTKKYKGKEYNYDGILIFEGEYKDTKKYKGKEYNYKGKLIFEGEYKEGKKWNGIFYNPENNENCGNLINGNGIIRSYDNGKLILMVNIKMVKNGME